MKFISKKSIICILIANFAPNLKLLWEKAGTLEILNVWVNPPASLLMMCFHY
jgi:hypothetical protein